MSDSGSEATGLCDCVTLRSPRLLQRGVPKARTRGNFRISHVGVSRFEQFVRSDIFHYLANMPLRWMLLIYCVVYCIAWLLFTLWWQQAAIGCEDNLDFRRAFLLSLETMTTIGYGVSDPMFNDCPGVIPLLVVQSLISLLMDAIFLNLMYTRFSTAFTRSASIIFTNGAVVYEEGGFVKIAFRVCEVARKPLIEPMVRLYLVKHGRQIFGDPDMEGFLDVDVCQMPLEEPNVDIADGKLFLTLPSKVVHCLNSSSPLSSGAVHSLQEFHEKIQAMDFFELIVVLSGTCPITGNSLEARQSYTASDLRYNCVFAPCVALRDEKHEVDFEYFHRTVKCGPHQTPSGKLSRSQ